ncbi:uncharacterized protein LOC121737536 [Aricia agestis]|uniref:uncharacterized protein LOC121737536 n=1 Tax=Aricia agestis TaxID=91739 RepID=UPI001C2081EC|nr:uncharacterized protein LOC121737536 [Aricia agestis]
MRVPVLILCVLGYACAGPIAQEESVLRVFVNNFVNCINSDLSLCLKEHALKATERLSAARKLDLVEGVTLINNEPREAKSLDILSSDPKERNQQITERLWTTTSELLRKSDLEVSFADDAADEKESRAIDDVEESRGKKKKLKKKLKLLLPLAILGKIKAIILIVGALLVIAASVFKIALLAKLAFVAKIIAIIKALIAKKSSHHVEEVWASPAYEEHGHGQGGWESNGWSRSRNEASNLAYSAYNQ